MNRFASLIALVSVVVIVSAMSVSFTGTSLAVATALVASAVLAYRFAQSVQLAAVGGAQTRGVREFAGLAVRNFLRFAVGAVVIAWMVVSALWLVAG